MRFQMSRQWVGMISVLMFAAHAPAQTNYLIYNDSLVNRFQDWSWAGHNLTNTSPVHSGAMSIRVSAKAWEGLFFRRDGSLPVTNCSGLSFWAHGGDKGGQYLMFTPVWDGRGRKSHILPELQAGNWQKITIPAELLAGEGGTNFQGFQLQLCAGVTDTFYLDDIQLDLNPAPAADSATPVVALAPPSRPAPASQPIPRPAATVDPATNSVTWWIVGSLAVIITLLGSLVFLFWRRSPVARTSLQLAPQGAVNVDASTTDDWKQRALAAEAMAGKQGQILREKIMPELTEFAKQSLVQGLYAQRNVLLDTQRKAHSAIEELESKLADLHLPLRERIRAYEKRIGELEKEVETQGEEMRELTRVTLELMRKKLENERERAGSRFN